MLKFIKNILNAPPSKYTDYYEIAKYELMWKLMVFLGLALPFITLFYFLFDTRAFGPSLYATIATYILLLWYYYKRDYKIVGFVFLAHSIIFLGIEMNYKTDTIHLIEFPWFFVFTMYGMLVLGRNVGVFLISISVFFITYYLFFSYKENLISILEYMTTINLLPVVLNLFMGLFLMGYLIEEFKATRIYADKQYKIANEELIKINNIVKAQNDEKTIMLKEIHHRVKNNLQVISSMIRLQSFETNDVSAKKMFDATVNRVVAMALIHEKMYQKDNLSKINLEDYLKSLAVDIFQSHTLNQSINFNIKSNLEVIGNRTIVPLALIFNELISNSLKYAFKQIDQGEIHVSIYKVDDDEFILKYFDNGIWMDTKYKSTFGLELIDTFVEQLDGELQRNSNGEGTTYILKLKNID
jgi:two-component sensor histidine kinase